MYPIFWQLFVIFKLAEEKNENLQQSKQFFN